MSSVEVTGKGEKVLILEDDDAILVLLAKMLSQAGYEPILSQRVSQALELSSTAEFPVALLDKNLPGGTGLEVMEHLSNVQPDCKVIILTAHVDSSSAIDALRVGAFDYLAKPISAKSLLPRVHAAVAAFRLEVTAKSRIQEYESKIDALLDECSWFMEMIPGIVFFHTRDGRFEALNAAGADMLGYDPSELIGQHYESILPPEDERPDDVKWAFEERRSGVRATHRRPIELLAKDGTRRIFEMSSRSAYHSGDGDGERTYGTLGVGYEVTDQVALQQQLRESQKMEAIGRLAGGIAHDFNNMLNVIDANLMMLLDTTRGEDRELLAEIGDATSRASILIKQLLTFSGAAHEPQSLTVRPGVQLLKIEPLLRRLLGQNVELVCEVGDDVEVLIPPGGLDQIIVNLAVNSRDAMPEGGQVLIKTQTTELDAKDLRTTPGMVPGTYAVLEIIDRGQGMDPAVKERLFEPFFTTKHPDHGTGLGLSVVYGVVRKCGGRVEIDSVLGQGTCVRVLLPAGRDELQGRDKLSEASGPAKVLSSAADGGAVRILVVEDEYLVRVVLRRTLEQAGHDVDEATGGAAALQMMNDADPVYDLLVTDIVMPEMDGAELAQKARARQPRLSVVYVSGYVGERLGARKLLTEHAIFVEKPVTAFNLLQAVNRLVDVRKAHDRGGAVSR